MPAEITRMTDDDIKAAIDIERICFPQPLSLDDFSRFIREGLAFISREGDSAHGYVVAEKILDESHIERIAVHPVFRRQGVGEGLLAGLIEDCVARGVKKIYLEVRESNFPSRALYTKMGFVETYVRKAYYSDNNEDAIVMEKAL